jgi:hypothetical protein
MSSNSVNAAMVGRRVSRRVSAMPVVRVPVASAVENIVTQVSLVAATTESATPFVTNDLHTVDEDGTVRPFSRKLNNVEEFYVVVADCLQHETLGKTLFEYLKQNLHLYDNDRVKFIADRTNIERAMSKSCSLSVICDSRVMRESDVYALYDVQRALNKTQRCAFYKDLSAVRYRISNRVGHKFNDYVRRLFGEVEPISDTSAVTGTSQSTSSVTHSGATTTSNTGSPADCLGDLLNLSLGSGDSDAEDRISSSTIIVGGSADSLGGHSDVADAEVDPCAHGRKRKQVERFTTAPELCAKSGSSKKRHTGATVTVAGGTGAMSTGDSSPIGEDSTDVKFIYIDTSEDQLLQDVPDYFLDKLKVFLKRIRPEQYDDVISLLESHAVEP